MKLFLPSGLLFLALCVVGSSGSRLRGDKDQGDRETPRQLDAIKDIFSVPAKTQVDVDVDDKEPDSGNTYIVELDDSIVDVEDHALALVRPFTQEEFDFVFSSSIKGFVITGLTPAQADILSTTAGVKSVDLDQEYKFDPVPVEYEWADNIKHHDRRRAMEVPTKQPWGTALVAGPDPPEYTDKHCIWIMDTGIANHPNLNVQTKKGFSAFAARKGNKKKADPEDLLDGNGHGTLVAGVAAGYGVGVAPGACVIPVKVLNATNGGTLSSIMAGIDWVAKNAKKGDVVNMSLGGPLSKVVNDAVAKGASKGVKYVVAAGNSGIDTKFASPASLNAPNVYTVSAIDKNHNLTPWSNYGEAVDFAMPGDRIVSTFLGGSFAKASGTSFSAPYLSGAFLQADSKKSDLEIEIYGYAGGDDRDGIPDPIAILVSKKKKSKKSKN